MFTHYIKSQTFQFLATLIEFRAFSFPAIAQQVNEMGNSTLSANNDSARSLIILWFFTAYDAFKAGQQCPARSNHSEALEFLYPNGGTQNRS